MILVLYDNLESLFWFREEEVRLSVMEFILLLLHFDPVSDFLPEIKSRFSVVQVLTWVFIFVNGWPICSCYE